MSSITITHAITKLTESAVVTGAGLSVRGISGAGLLGTGAPAGCASAAVVGFAGAAGAAGNAGSAMGEAVRVRRPEMRDVRPLWALGAAVAAKADHGYAAGADTTRITATAGTATLQQSQYDQLHQTVSMRAFRGLEPWRERT